MRLLHAGKQMAMSTSRTASLMEEADIGGSALARVPVSPPLPLLAARLEAPGLRSEAPAKVEGVCAALLGQSVEPNPPSSCAVRASPNDHHYILERLAGPFLQSRGVLSQCCLRHASWAEWSLVRAAALKVWVA